MTTKEIFGRNLRNKLEAKRKTQIDLAKYLGVTATAVSRWVNGEAMPRADMLDKICQYFMCTADELMTDHAKPVAQLPEDVLAEELHNNPRLFRLMFYASKLTDDQLDKIISIVGEMR